MFKGVLWPARPKLGIWLALLVPLMPPFLKSKPSPSPRLDAGVGPGLDWELGAVKLGVLGVESDGAVDAGRSGLLGGLGLLLFEGADGFV